MHKIYYGTDHTDHKDITRKILNKILIIAVFVEQPLAMAGLLKITNKNKQGVFLNFFFRMSVKK